MSVCWILPAALFFLAKTPRKKPVASDAPRASGSPTHKGVLIGTLSTFLGVSFSAVIFPFTQARRDALGCDAMCVGGLTSLRSGLGLVGAALIGRASDRFGRVSMLYVGTAATLVSLAINYGMDSIAGIWWAIVPVALFNQNFTVLRALISDYIDESGGNDADKAGAVGKLGMAVGFSFMAGPLLATLLVSSYQQALVVSAVGTLASGGLLLLLPTPQPGGAGAGAGRGAAAAAVAPGSSSAAGQPESTSASPLATLMQFVSLPVLRLRGAQLLMAMRLLMAMAYHMFMPVWQVSIKARFDFAPADHARFMGLVGLTYALSQGVVAKPLVRRTRGDPSYLLMLCVLCLGGLRPVALWTTSLSVVYACYVPMVLALGVMNTAIATACSNLADRTQLGGFIGVLESVESLSGIIGPTVGGLATRAWGETGAVLAVCGCYAAVLLLILLFFGAHVAAASKATAAAAADTTTAVSGAAVSAAPAKPEVEPTANGHAKTA